MPIKRRADLGDPITTPIKISVPSVRTLRDDKKRNWLALEDDFRTLGISQIVIELPQFNQLLVR